MSDGRVRVGNRKFNSYRGQRLDYLDNLYSLNGISGGGDRGLKMKKPYENSKTGIYLFFNYFNQFLFSIAYIPYFQE